MSAYYDTSFNRWYIDCEKCGEVEELIGIDKPPSGTVRQANAVARQRGWKVDPDICEECQTGERR